MTGHGRRLASPVTRCVVAVTATAALAGCAGRPYIDYEPVTEPTGPKPEVSFRATFDQNDRQLTIDYQLVNRDDTSAVVFNGVPAKSGRTTIDNVYLTPRGDGLVEISKRVFPVPEGVNPAGLERLAGTTVGVGQQVAERLTVPLPLRPHRPYQGGLEQPPKFGESVRAVVFCVGVARSDAVTGDPAAGGPTTYRHDTPTTTAQYLFCSNSYALEG